MNYTQPYSSATRSSTKYTWTGYNIPRKHPTPTLTHSQFLHCLHHHHTTHEPPSLTASPHAMLTRSLGRTSVVLLSGGLDSATVLAMARKESNFVHALSFSYGQRHSVELRAAQDVARQVGATSHHVCSLDTALFKSPLTDATVELPKGRTSAQISDGTIASTYVPARNTVFLSHALAYAESLGADRVYIGANAVDYSGYPDCRPEYFEAFQRVAELGTRAGVEGVDTPRIVVPLLMWTKRQIVEEGLRLGVDFGLTSSCYDPAPSGRPCQRCDACILRADAFTSLGYVVDPAVKRYDDEEREREGGSGSSGD